MVLHLFILIYCKLSYKSKDRTMTSLKLSDNNLCMMLVLYELLVLTQLNKWLYCTLFLLLTQKCYCHFLSLLSLSHLKAFIWKTFSNLLLGQEETVPDKEAQRINHKNCMDCRHLWQISEDSLISFHWHLCLWQVLVNRNGDKCG